MSWTATIAPTGPAPGLLQADAWSPAIDLAHLRRTMRLGDVITADRLQDAVLGALQAVRVDLRAWRAARTAEGHATLAAVPADQLAGTSVHVLAWRRAVYAYACADLAETHRDISATAEGAARAEERALPADDYRRNALSAIRDIKGAVRQRARLV